MSVWVPGRIGKLIRYIRCAACHRASICRSYMVIIAQEWAWMWGLFLCEWNLLCIYAVVGRSRNGMGVTRDGLLRLFWLRAPGGVSISWFVQQDGARV